MGLKALLLSLRKRADGFARTRAIRSLLFSGTPVLEKIRLDRSDDGPIFTLFYKNGLMLSLGDSGILDYQDRSFDGFVGPASRAAGDREFLASLHRIVLKSLLRHITAPRLEARQRERAAEAASRLWLACSGRPPTSAAAASESTTTRKARGRRLAQRPSADAGHSPADSGASAPVGDRQRAPAQSAGSVIRP